MEDERSSPRVSPPATTTTSAAAHGGGVAGTIRLRRSPPPPSAADAIGGVHLLPCSIKHNGPCAISHYFKPRTTDVEVDGLSVEEAFFRGRKLLGATVPIPDGYRGYILERKKLGKGKDAEGSTDGDFSSWASRAEFRSVTYWDHDILPSTDDPLLRCFHWFPVANALHKPVTAEELAKASKAVQDKKQLN
ncbi:ribonuclease H2 subunit C [Ananas comosus]|uniref:Ribonuclease H2 subunit C n=1 Tax=Ananas comosus TaxID=4615 RepID=A0A199V332_ANACO|nr:ribonuclease H2 subunit C [Ananas comosus]OAY71492.1 Ribonuclease H2 subunit C [Ananas comosus]